MNSVLVNEPLVFVDLETTGANFANDRIMEIGIVQVDEHGAREWSSFVNPGIAIPQFITGLTGIHSGMVENAPRFEELAPLILEKLKGRLFVAHNARFDYTFLKREFKQIGMEFRAPNLCTVKLSRKLFPAHHRHSLDSLITRYGIRVADRHRALADARVLWDLWQHWSSILPAESFNGTIAELVGRPELPPQIDPRIIDDIPESPGAYAFFTSDGTLLPSKRCANIRQQVLAHFAAKNRDTAAVRDVERIEWKETAGEFGARMGELELSSSTRKPLDELCSWQLIQRSEGHYQPELVFASSLDFATTPDLFGLYMSKKEALLTLRKLVEAHHLCHSLVGLGVGKPGEACVGFKQKTCRGACVGKEALPMHSARLMASMAKIKLAEWPYPGAVALIERDEFGMREDFHLLDRWRYLGIAQSESEVYETLNGRREARFDPEIYRIANKYLKAGKLRVLPLKPMAAE
ncbi:MAG: exonuclease domain-containing protein [Betaproteobacteria bacterium]